MNFVLALSLLISFQMNSDWELKREKNGIQVFTKKIEGSTFKAFKANMNVQAGSLEEVTSAILDVENYVNLVPNTKKSKILEVFNDGKNIHYSYSDAPWPISDRDGIYEQNAIYFPNERKVVVDLLNIDQHPKMPPIKGVVRMKEGSGKWIVKELEKENFYVYYEHHGEPGGNIPAWFANAVVVDIPYDLFTNLKKVISSGRYSDSSLDFIN